MPDGRGRAADEAEDARLVIGVGRRIGGLGAEGGQRGRAPILRQAWMPRTDSARSSGSDR